MLPRRRSLIPVSVLALMVAALGCGQGSQSKAAATGGGTATVALNGDWGPLDLTDGTVVGTGYSVLTAFYDRLLAQDANSKLIPYLAKSWTATATTFSFSLRTDATCADGTPVTATVVRNSFQPYLKSADGRRLFGAGPWTITADDSAHTITFVSATPYSDAIFGFADPMTGIVCPAGLTNPPATQAQQTSGSGPYTIESSVHGDHLTAKLRRDWKWGPAGTSAGTLPDELTFKVVTDVTTAANLVATGGVNVALITGPDLQRLKATKSLGHIQTHSYYLFTLGINQLPGRPGADIKVRQAIITAIDPVAWNTAALNGTGIVGTSLATKDGQCYDPVTEKLAPKHSIAGAQQVLKDAGYTLGSDGKFSKNGQPLTLNVLSSVAQGAGPDYLSTTLNAVGFTVKLNNLDAASFSLQATKLNFDVTILHNISSAIPSITQPLAYLVGGKLINESGTNFSTILDPTLTSLYNTAVSASTTSEKCRSLNQLQEALWTNWDTEPIAAGTYDWFTNDHWTMIPVTNRLHVWSLTRKQ